LQDTPFHKISVALMVTSLILMGCASSLIDLSKTKSVPKDEGIIFGRVKVIDTDKMKIANLSSVFGESTFTLTLLPDGSSKGIYHPLHGEGYFYWHLPKGGYSIAGFEWKRDGIVRGRIFAHFNVPKDGTITYIGTLAMSFGRGRYTRFIEDDYDLAMKAFRDVFPEIEGDISKDLMRMEAQR